MRYCICLFIYGIIITAALLFNTSCTEHTKARRWGGEEVLTLPKGEKLLEVTWKDQSSIWYLVEDMDSDYIPKTKTFQESSRFGILEGKIIFIENR